MEWKMKLKISYSRVQISSDEVFSKIMKKPSIENDMYLKIVFIVKKKQNGRLKKKLVFQLHHL